MILHIARYIRLVDPTEPSVVVCDDLKLRSEWPTLASDRTCMQHLQPVTKDHQVREDVVLHFPMGRRNLTVESIRHTGPKRCESSSHSFHIPACYRRGSERVKEHRVIPKNQTMHTQSSPLSESLPEPWARHPWLPAC